ncbi:MAG: hypothetical protein L3J67_04715 [Hyphomicrobiaceae bacterium]|nr:hypothetical protein [Hyphomicrobiaceae bacterium]
MKTGLFSIKRFALVGLAAFLLLLPFGVHQVESKAASPSKSGIELLMFKQQGCHYCQVWDENIGGIYDKTPEGKFAPLRRVDIHFDDKIANVKPVIFTPTFVLYKRGKEIGRVTGYMSDNFFWGLLEVLLKQNGFRPEQHVGGAG